MTHNKTILCLILALSLTTGFMHKTYGMGKGEDLAHNAELNKGSTEWAKSAEKDQRGINYTFHPQSWKCNLFIYDMLYNSGINPPLTTGNWPITAAMWTKNISGFNKVSSQQRGDIISDGSHCGIALDDASTIIAAGEFSVNTDYPFYDGNYPTIQRYDEK